MNNNIKSILYKPYSLIKHNIYITTKLYRKDSNQKNILNYINSKNLVSTTYYLIAVDTKNFRTYIFTGSKNNWKLVKNYVCSIGKPSTPTPKVNFTVGIKGLSFGERHGYKCRYYTQFKGNYLFHSIIYNLNGSVRDGRLGMALSDGCVRLSLENAKWIYENIPKGTLVNIF